MWCEQTLRSALRPALKPGAVTTAFRLSTCPPGTSVTATSTVVQLVATVTASQPTRCLLYVVVTVCAISHYRTSIQSYTRPHKRTLRIIPDNFCKVTRLSRPLQVSKHYRRNLLSVVVVCWSQFCGRHRLCRPLCGYSCLFITLISLNMHFGKVLNEFLLRYKHVEFCCIFSLNFVSLW